MEIVSIDIETTGTSLNETNQILEVCAVIFNTKSIIPPDYNNPTFNVRINYDFLSGNPFALNMNKQLIEDLVTYHKYKKEYDAGTLTDQALIDLCSLYVEPEEVAELFLSFLLANGITTSVNFAGKNVGVFDNPFLNNTVPFWSEIIKCNRRTIDPAILYVDNETDEQLPNLEQCKERSGLFKNNVVSHKALEDAMDVAVLVYDKLNECIDSGVRMEVIDYGYVQGSEGVKCNIENAKMSGTEHDGNLLKGFTYLTKDDIIDVGSVSNDDFYGKKTPLEKSIQEAEELLDSLNDKKEPKYDQ